MDSLPQFSMVDIGALLLLIVGAIQGFFRGLSGELARLFGAVIAFVAGISLRQPVGSWILENSRLEERAANAVAFITTILLAFLIMLILRMIIKRIAKGLLPEGGDKTMGVIAGTLRMGVIVFVIFLCMNMIPHEYLNRVFGDESVIGSVVLKYVPAVRSTLEEKNIIHSKKDDKESVEKDNDAPNTK